MQRATRWRCSRFCLHSAQHSILAHFACATHQIRRARQNLLVYLNGWFDLGAGLHRQQQKLRASEARNRSFIFLCDARVWYVVCSLLVAHCVSRERRKAFKDKPFIILRGARATVLPASREDQQKIYTYGAWYIFNEIHMHQNATYAQKNPPVTPFFDGFCVYALGAAIMWR